MLPKSKIQAIGLLAAVAVAGFAAGAATMSRAETKPPVNWRERCTFSGMMKDRLSLSDAQRDSVKSIMRRHRPEMHAVMDRVRPQIDSVRAVITTEVRAVLSPAQRIRYDSIQAADRAEHARLDSTRNAAGTR
ncbi:MAG TPA: periplasmic heavy metal sensor [Gemmatimonadales bacterium]|jgi:Spy/CpxP family protein refolding chaperone